MALEGVELDCGVLRSHLHVRKLITSRCEGYSCDAAEQSRRKVKTRAFDVSA